MSCFFLCFTEISLGLYILLALLFCLFFASSKFYSFPSFLPLITATSIFIFLLVFYFLINVSDPTFSTLEGLFLFSPFNSFFQALLFFTGCAILFLNRSYYSCRLLVLYEFDLLVLSSFLGMAVLCCANDLLSVYVALELQSLSFYVLATFWKNSEYSTEAGLKYFLIGAFSSCILLFSFSFIYLSVGTTSIDAIVSITSDQSIRFSSMFFAAILFFVSIFFKLGAAPCHFWICDVYEGSLVNVSAFFSVVPKAVIICVLCKFILLVFSDLNLIGCSILFVIGFLSVLISSLVALYQKKIKRLLAFSAVGHVGFILLSLSSVNLDSIKFSVVYLVIYIIMGIGLFSLLVGLSSRGFLLKYVINWSFLKKWNPLIAICFSLLVFSVAGIPPLAGFYSKLNVLISLIVNEQTSLALILVVLSCVSCFYYIRLIKLLFFSSQFNDLSFEGSFLKGFDFLLVSSVLFVTFFLLKPESLNFLLSSVTLSFLC